MYKTNLHTHTDYCDGKCKTEEMILSAIECKFHSIGISTHGPVPFETDWNIKKEKVEEYIDEVLFLKKKYKNEIQVFLGMELDYIPEIGFDEFTQKLIKRLDYYIGSVHYLGMLKNKTMWTVDYNTEELIQGINESFNGNVRNAVEAYYKTISEMAHNFHPPIIGHLDLIKKNNKNNVLFDENEEWYKYSVEKCLDIIKNTKSIIEINTGGIARGYTFEQYPSTFILKMIKERNIPVIINSDAHTREGIDCKFNEMNELLKAMEFSYMSILTKNGWTKDQI
ncbi:MAG: histidinol-phosphatase HisJ [Sedimentibacter sp.]